MHYPSATANAVAGAQVQVQLVLVMVSLVGALIAGPPAELEELRSCAGCKDPAGLGETAQHMRGATR